MSRWKQGDTKPDMVIRCFDDQGRPANLSGASSVTVIAVERGVEVWRRLANKPSDGVVTLTLQPTDVANVGQYKIKVRVVWPDGAVQHYPPADEWLTMLVTR